MPLPEMSKSLASAVKVIESRSGSVVVQVCTYSPKERTAELRELGFAWDKARRVLLRFAADEGAELNDLLATEALAIEMLPPPEDRVEFRLRAFAPSVVRDSVKRVMEQEGIAFDRRQNKWATPLNRELRARLSGKFASRSGEAASRREAEARLAKTIETRATQRQSGFERKRHEWETLRAQDSSFSRRDYEYTQRLKLMRRHNDFQLGSDGAPNWPDPPTPNGFSWH